MVRIRPELLKERIVTHLESADAVNPADPSHSEVDLEAIPSDEEFLTQAFQRILGRALDLDAFLHFSEVLKSHPRHFVLATIRRAAHKPELVIEVGDLLRIKPDADFVRAVYVRMLGREGDPDGITDWQQRMEGGLPRCELLLAFSRCEEAAQTEYNFQGVPLDTAARVLAGAGVETSPGPEPFEADRKSVV